VADALVVGAGPVGLTLACELARHGVRCRIIDKLSTPLPFCRAIGITPRTLEVWEDMGVVREMIDAGLWITGMRSIVSGQPAIDALVPGVATRLLDSVQRAEPTGGQGMNTGIQDAYNLAWKLALVLDGAAPEALLDSYEAERRPVGADVVARTRAASENFGKEPGGKPDRQADTQILVSYRGTDWIRDDAKDVNASGPVAGDRAPDAQGLWRHGVGFPVRMFEILAAFLSRAFLT
jgi:2-polyprenyl-6-methoxyphenol hydroxylase-like FAD-dependent oxidoreductase